MPGLLLCEHCGRQLITLSDLARHQTRSFATIKSPTAPLSYPKPGTGYLHQSRFVTLDLLDVNKKLTRKTEGHILLGRADPSSGWQPTIDLTPYDAADRGVSRNHADLFFESDQVFVLEMGSVNGTRVNGIAVRTGEAHQIHDGDLIELGKLRLKVYFI
ncbi:MAG: FHA domain-containing protein [Chloroflexota bacterium]